MVLGMSLATYTLLHVVISLAGIGSGLIVMYGFFIRKPLNSWTALFLITTVLTSVTGFLFPFEHLLPSHILGILSLIVLAAAIPARYVFHMTGAWRWIYVIGASTALYLNVFVLVAQLFLKIPILHATCANTEGTALRHRSTCCSGDFRWTDDWRDQEVPHRSGTRTTTRGLSVDVKFNPSAYKSNSHKLRRRLCPPLPPKTAQGSTTRTGEPDSPCFSATAGP